YPLSSFNIYLESFSKHKQKFLEEIFGRHTFLPYRNTEFFQFFEISFLRISVSKSCFQQPYDDLPAPLVGNVIGFFQDPAKLFLVLRNRFLPVILHHLIKNPVQPEIFVPQVFLHPDVSPFSSSCKKK